MYQTIIPILCICYSMACTAGTEKEQRVLQKAPYHISRTSSYYHTKTELDVAHTLLHLRKACSSHSTNTHQSHTPHLPVTERTVPRNTTNRILHRLQYERLSPTMQTEIVREMCRHGNIQDMFTREDQTHIVHRLISRRAFALLYNLHEKGLSLSGYNVEQHSALDRLIQGGTYKTRKHAPYLLVRACVDEQIPVTRNVLHSRYNASNTRFFNNLDALFTIDIGLRQQMQLPSRVERAYQRHVAQKRSAHK